MRDTSVVPDTLRICDVCGGLAYGEDCPTCEDYRELIDRCGIRSSEFWRRLPRINVDEAAEAECMLRDAMIELAASLFLCAVMALGWGFVCGWL